MDQELMLRASFLEQQAKEIEASLELVTRQVTELEQFSDHLSFFQKSKENQMLAPLGKGIYLKTSYESKKLFVEVGSGVVVQKTPEETQEIIEAQLKRLKEIRLQLSEQLQIYTHHLDKTLHDIEQQQPSS